MNIRTETRTKFHYSAAEIAKLIAADVEQQFGQKVDAKQVRFLVSDAIAGGYGTMGNPPNMYNSSSPASLDGAEAVLEVKGVSTAPAQKECLADTVRALTAISALDATKPPERGTIWQANIIRAQTHRIGELTEQLKAAAGELDVARREADAVVAAEAKVGGLRRGIVDAVYEKQELAAKLAVAETRRETAEWALKNTDATKRAEAAEAQLAAARESALEEAAVLIEKSELFRVDANETAAHMIWAGVCERDLAQAKAIRALTAQPSTPKAGRHDGEVKS